MKNLLSLFDYSGGWPMPFAQNGWDTYMWDIKDEKDIHEIDAVEYIMDNLPDDVQGILAAVPCTDFANSGARWFKGKDANGTTDDSIELVHQVLRIVDFYQPSEPGYYDEIDEPFFWAIENPVGRMETLIPQIGKGYYFQPCDFAGYLNLTDADHNELDRLRRKDGKGITAAEAQFIIDCNAYTKKTGLWGDFNREIVKNPIEPVKGSPFGSVMMRFGGKSEATKTARSNTPAGFAQAFYNANCEHQAEIC